LTAAGEPVELSSAIELASVQAPEPAPGGLVVVDAQAREGPPFFTSATLYLERILAAAAERHSDDAGLALPARLAPFDVVITPVNYSDATLKEAADSFYRDCQAARLDVLLDDRDERPGVKFNDADLIGIPYRITIGRKVSEGLVEVYRRAAKTKTEVRMADAVELVRNWRTEDD
jgi:prolyl-tRNA synthetase